MNIGGCVAIFILAAGQGGARDGGKLAQGEGARADRAIQQSLVFLKKSQQPDGAWDSGGFGPATSVTSLAVMAMLAAGHVPGEPGPYRESIEKGIRYVLAHQHENGLIASNTANGPMYCHGISTLMLAEVAGMTGEAELGNRVRSALVRAVKLILAAQDVPKNADQAGGWRYAPHSNDSDISVTGWQLMALKAAKSAGCDVPSSSIDRAVAYLKKCAVKNGGGFSYQAHGSPNNPRTGTGILALEICGEHLTAEAVAAQSICSSIRRGGRASIFSTKRTTARSRCFNWGTSTFCPITPSWWRSCSSTSKPMGAGSPMMGMTGAGAGITARRWGFWRWRWSIGICLSINDNLSVVSGRWSKIEGQSFVEGCAMARHLGRLVAGIVLVVGAGVWEGLGAGWRVGTRAGGAGAVGGRGQGAVEGLR